MNYLNQEKPNQGQIKQKKSGNIKYISNVTQQTRIQQSLPIKELFSINYGKIQYQLLDYQPFEENNDPSTNLFQPQSKQYGYRNNYDKYSFSIDKYLDEQAIIPQLQVLIQDFPENIEAQQQTPQIILKNLVNQGKITQTSSSHQQDIEQRLEMQQDEYMPDCLNSTNYQYRKACQTKNITKNFGKSIITFILKQKQFTRRFAKQRNINQKHFLRKIKSFQNKVATIKGLRSFWLQQTNSYAKQVRIMSWIYIRKHSLAHIFNSRVQNLSINIKYRIRMLESLSKPVEFTCIKQN